MKKKGLLIVLLFMFIGIGSLFAQSSGFIKPTFSFGLASARYSGWGSDSGIVGSFDLDFVNSMGLTIGVQAWTYDGDIDFSGTAGGVGYTYDGGSWCIGAKLMYGAIMDVVYFGSNVNGTYWLYENIGISGLIDLNFPKDMTIIAVRVGVSMKF